MIRSPLYPHPVNLAYMTRILPDKPPATRQILPDAKQFVQICNKVVRYDPDSAQVSETRFLGREILDPSTMIQRLFVRWANGVRYSYPGTYDDPRNPAFERRWDTFAEPSDQKKILWSAPYEAPLSALRVTCRYPMFARNGDFLGVAGLELRLECLLAPLIQDWIPCTKTCRQQHGAVRKENRLADLLRFRIPDPDNRRDSDPDDREKRDGESRPQGYFPLRLCHIRRLS